MLLALLTACALGVDGPAPPGTPAVQAREHIDHARHAADDLVDDVVEIEDLGAGLRAGTVPPGEAVPKMRAALEAARSDQARLDEQLDAARRELSGSP
ncbi:MAG: hypothetical protein H6739_00225 [Alphaproteobacteria bacterium]|nr:hypothetical protein [Alphaproteobacteria bacterium]